jgi:hypothetical protein
MRARATRLEEARTRLSRLARSLANAIGPAEAAGIILSAGVDLLVRVRGSGHAVAYLCELADQLERAPARRPPP